MDKLKNNIGVIMVILGLIGSTGAFYSKFAKMELTIEQLSTATAPDLSGIETNGFAIMDNTTTLTKLEAETKKEIAILQREIQLLNLQIKEIKVSNSNPLQ
jgi:hypothetical protein|tara:strand:+ start:23 stop:325 length:303 start_codon:yes stop_codon:yes gene_type:complete